MFDFAKTELRVYTHPVPGYSDRPSSAARRFGIPVLTMVLLGVAGFTFLSRTSTPTANTQTNLASPTTLVPYIQPIPPTTANIELTPGLDLNTKNSEATPASNQVTDDTSATTETSGPNWKEHLISSGESLSTIFNDLELGQSLLLRLDAASPKEYSLNKIKPGQIIKVQLNAEGTLQQIIWIKSPVDSLIITPKADGFSFEKSTKELERRERHTSGVIKNSLFIDGQKQGLTENTILALIDVFKWDVDFALNVKKGDRFSLIYDEYYLNGKKYADGDLVAAEFVNQGKSYRAVRYEHQNGKVDYFTPEGKSLRKDFLMTPVNFSRISSNFTPERWHPILQKWRAHKGVDYAAPTGTAIKAAADGKITFSGWQGGYGNVVIIEHGKQHTTVYGHMSRFASNSKVGTKVSQGEIIGYVGQTGLASGPHLHYEIRIADKFVDPVKVTSLGIKREIPKQYAKTFKTRAQEYFSQLDLLKADRVAQLAPRNDNNLQ